MMLLSEKNEEKTYEDLIVQNNYELEKQKDALYAQMSSIHKKITAFYKGKAIEFPVSEKYLEHPIVKGAYYKKVETVRGDQDAHNFIITSYNKGAKVPLVKHHMPYYIVLICGSIKYGEELKGPGTKIDIGDDVLLPHELIAMEDIYIITVYQNIRRD